MNMVNRYENVTNHFNVVTKTIYIKDNGKEVEGKPYPARSIEVDTDFLFPQHGLLKVETESNTTDSPNWSERMNSSSQPIVDGVFFAGEYLYKFSRTCLI